jgi:hypothetical protein
MAFEDDVEETRVVPDDAVALIISEQEEAGFLQVQVLQSVDSDLEDREVSLPTMLVLKLISVLEEQLITITPDGTLVPEEELN